MNRHWHRVLAGLAAGSLVAAAQTESALRYTGTVRDPSGAPVEGLTLKAFPEYRANIGNVKTDANGRFEFTYTPRRSGSSDQSVCILARDVKRKLAVAQDLNEETRTLDLRLEPGLTIRGQVEDPNGKPITNALATVFLWSGNSGSSFDKPLPVDARGKFEATGLPPGRRYSLSVSAKGYGSDSSRIEEAGPDSREVEHPPFVLKVADRPLAGRVVDSEEKPVAEAYVYTYGQGQPNENARTDAKGFFAFAAVCEGTVRVSVSHQSSYGSTSTEGGDTNVLLTLGSNSSNRREAPKRPALTGHPLPDLAPFGLTPAGLPAGRPSLICLFDCEQRPSRRCLSLLAGQQEALRRKGLAVAAIQAVVVDADTLKAWKESTPLPFPVGQTPDKSDKIRWVAALDTFPWLILVDAKGQVAAEGFALDELEERLQALSH